MVVDCGSYFLVATPHEATKVLPAPLLELEVAPLQLQSVAWEQVDLNFRKDVVP